ncbi:SDR family NAD(P)-dependent oxidoreductase [Jiella marina]|uniref:SDR family NAD(P)-dependent oxidoreductase n=1 Tax=Jiella sp. LLJ827 TaxID=2917712 RepID=UPI002101A3F1|nr:SDR family oxidoreductase [Jiella sp. LLJ827]MCQ0986101.1 SDR family oxidoreductase [Jiella sp. LLJ827]
MNKFALKPGFRAAVIGGAGGIGLAIVKELRGLGAEVSATGISEAEIKACEIDGDVRFSVLDVTNGAAVSAYAEETGPVDLLVNCAGILRRDEEYELDVFRQVLEVNLIGTMAICLAFREGLAERKGSIVNIASMNAFAALPRLPGYCASKGGVVMLTRSLALAWAAEGIRVNAVAPGFIETNINAEGRKDEAHYQKIADRTAFKRWGQPDDVTGTVAYLAMPAAAYVTGAVYAVDGGFLAG